MKHIKLLKTIGLTAVLGASLIGFANTASADTHYDLQYFESYFDRSESDDQAFKIGYIDKNGHSKSIIKTTDHVNEYITDKSKGYLTGDLSNGSTVEIVRSPYQVYDVKTKSNNVTTIGYDDFRDKYIHSDKKGTVDVKWYDTISNDNSSVNVMEFAYKEKLYRMYMPTSSNGYYAFREQVSMNVNSPKLVFNNDDTMTYVRAPYNLYIQPEQKGVVTKK